MAAYKERMPAGIAGAITRTASATLEPCIIGTAPVAFGALVKCVGNTVQPIGAEDTAEAIYGLLARSYPTQSDSLGNQDGFASPNTQQSVLRRGYMAIVLKSGTANKHGQVYVRIVAGSGHAVGDFEAVPDGEGGENTLAVPNCFFMGQADENGNTEVAFNI